jgi:hypothetical protein
MNRVLFALALGVVGLSMMGCATAVDDPVVPTPAPEAQRDPPEQTLGGQLHQPQLQEISNIENPNAVSPILNKQRPPIPQPVPAAAE